MFNSYVVGPSIPSGSYATRALLSIFLHDPETGSCESSWNHSFDHVSAGGKTAVKKLKHDIYIPENLFLYTKEVWFVVIHFVLQNTLICITKHLFCWIVVELFDFSSFSNQSTYGYVRYYSSTVWGMIYSCIWHSWVILYSHADKCSYLKLLSTCLTLEYSINFIALSPYYIHYIKVLTNRFISSAEAWLMSSNWQWISSTEVRLCPSTTPVEAHVQITAGWLPHLIILTYYKSLSHIIRS